MSRSQKFIYMTLSFSMICTLAACDRPPEVLQERANLKAVKEKAANDIAAAQAKAIKDVNDTKQDAARKILAAERSLHEAEILADGRAAAPSTDEYPLAGEKTVPPNTTEAKASSETASGSSQSGSTQSGSTTSADDTPVTPAECAKYALEKVIKPELKQRYQACSKLHRK